MRDHYDFSNMQGEKNPYAKQLKQPITIRLDKTTIAYFKALAKNSACRIKTSSIFTCATAPKMKRN